MSNSEETTQPGSINDECNHNGPQLFCSNLPISEKLLRRIRERRARSYPGGYPDIFTHYEEEQQSQHQLRKKAKKAVGHPHLKIAQFQRNIFFIPIVTNKSISLFLLHQKSTHEAGRIHNFFPSYSPALPLHLRSNPSRGTNKGHA